MFDTSETFFKGLGLEGMTNKFWDNSVFVKDESVNMTWYEICLKELSFY